MRVECPPATQSRIRLGAQVSNVFHADAGAHEVMGNAQPHPLLQTMSLWPLGRFVAECVVTPWQLFDAFLTRHHYALPQPRPAPQQHDAMYAARRHHRDQT